MFDGGCGRRERVIPCSMSAAGGSVAGCCVSTAPLVFGNGFEGLALVPVIEVECVGRGSFRGLPTEARGPPGSDGALAFADKDGSATTGPSRAEATEPVMPSKTSERIRRGLATRSSSCRACCPVFAFFPASPGGGLTGFGCIGITGRRRCPAEQNSVEKAQFKFLPTYQRLGPSRLIKAYTLCEVHNDEECQWVAGCMYPATGRGGQGGGAHNPVDGARSIFEHLGLSLCS